MPQEREHIWGPLSHLDVLIDDQVVIEVPHLRWLLINANKLSEPWQQAFFDTFAKREKFFFHGDIVEVPLLTIFNLDAVQGKRVFIIEVVIHVYCEVNVVFWGSHSF